MFTQEDILQIQQKGMSEAQIEAQLECFRKGFDFLKLKGAAAVGDGIVAPSEDEAEAYIKAWNDYKAEGHNITKFVPASGAASRMFKNMFEFLDADYEVPTTDFEKAFFAHIHYFAFFDALNDACFLNEGKGVDALIEEGEYKAVVANMLGEEGLNYGQLPKGLLQFHSYDDCAKTPVEEHLTEAALYASSRGEAEVHFTVSSEHRKLFEELIERVVPEAQEKFKITYKVSLSEQKPSTDTIAVNMDNTPFRTSDGKLLFRPGGHGALIENLNDLKSDIVFIKNIDNVVPDRLKGDTVFWKQVIAGVLVDAQKKVFGYLRLLDSGKFSHDDLEDIIRFVRHTLCCDVPNLKNMEDTELHVFLKNKLNRPIRVCGVVKNVGEPGGGPFLAYNPDGSISLQILESSQIDKNNAEYMKMFTQGTHFNPVDLVCAIRNYKGEKFNLPDFVDPATGFISYKSKDGKELKALELPGLWNGAMSDWNTIMVEVPLTTFNPVKTVNDLLRPQHQKE
ncbi:MAG: DUF4301 family protein [Bacteroidaceae bacterium]|nr:DUF4301 family protein [Bacteroidaceae bacterium]